MTTSSLPPGAQALVPPVVLVGPPGVGKTTVGPAVADALGLRFVDLDVRADAASYDGSRASEASFRVREHRALRAALHEGAVVIAAGGGITDADDNRALISRALVIALDAPASVCLTRLGGSTRPWLSGSDDERARTYAAREADRPDVRRALARSSVDARGDVHDVVGAVVAAARAARMRVVPDADVADALDVVGDATARGARAFVVADPRVAAALPHVDHAVAIDGAHKRLANVDALLAVFAAAGLRRTDTIVAVGGGVLLDVTGLAAGLYHRGTPWRAVPTTLLAMVDAGLGGKTAVDVVAADGAVTRNGAGLIHAPASAHVWPGFLRTLADDALRHGRAEMLKHALLAGDTDLVAACATDASAIALSRGFKRAVVDVDAHERHLRHALNLGHTFAHALESVTGIAHGDAVLFGLRAALTLSERTAGLRAHEADRARVAVEGLSPPDLRLDGAERARLHAALERDKKGGRYVVLRALGEPVLVPRAAVADADIDAAIDSMTKRTPAQ